ncbi:acetyltransferase [Caulobacter vibrioides]|nr:acetyltransferase [Caulobacter vibrioides]
MISYRQSFPDDGDRVVEIWRRAVDATHDFLKPEDRAAIEAEVAGFLPTAPMWLAVGDDDVAVAFMFVEGAHMQALFVDPDHRGTGVGRNLVTLALAMQPNLTTDVNEQNAQALGFYERMGFVPTGRSETDGQGRSYPLIHLRKA